MKIGIVGVGVVGGVTAEVLSSHHELYLYDKYKKPFSVLGKLAELAHKSEVIFICVPTPMKESGKVNLEIIFKAVRAVYDKINFAKQLPLIVIRSTVPPGTTDRMADIFLPLRFAVNPEFLREKTALEDMKKTKRVVIGTADVKSAEQLTRVYESVFPQATCISVNRRTAEMIKYASNIMLSSQVMIANELYQICQHLGVDYDSVKETILLDKRIARNIDVPGHDGHLGFGGKCFGKDLNALIYAARESGYRAYLLEEVWRTNKKVREGVDEKK